MDLQNPPSLSTQEALGQEESIATAAVEDAAPHVMAKGKSSQNNGAFRNNLGSWSCKYLPKPANAYLGGGDHFEFAKHAKRDQDG